MALTSLGLQKSRRTTSTLRCRSDGRPSSISRSPRWGCSSHRVLDSRT